MKIVWRPVLFFMSVLTSLTLHAESATNSTELPPMPWHLADIFWDFQETTTNFESFDVDFVIEGEVSDKIGFYISPCGLGELSGIQFYGGLQSNVGAWASRTNHSRVNLGKGAIFSRWGKKGLSVDQARGADDSHYEAAGYEGDFVSVRRPFKWSEGRYTWSLRACDTENIDGKDYTWVSCFITSAADGKSRYVGSLRFEGKNLTFWKHHTAFVEIYSLDEESTDLIPKVKVTFEYPRVNGRTPKFKGAHAFHPGPGQQSGAPNCAKATAQGSNIVVTTGPVFERDAKDRTYALGLKVD